MSQPESDAMPLPNKLSQTAESTSGGQESVQWVQVVAAVSPMEASILKSKLESNDIPAIIQQESIGSVMGLTVGPLGSASVYTPEELVERAFAILSEEVDTDDYQE